MEALLDPLTAKKSAKKAQKRKPDAPPADTPAPQRSRRSNPADTAPTTTTPDNEPLDQTPDDAPAPRRSRRSNPGYMVPTPTTTSDNKPLPEQMRTTATPDPPTTASATPPVVNSESPNQIPEGRSSLRASQEGQLLPIGQDPAVERARHAGEVLGAADLLACPASAPAWFVDARGDITREGLGPHYNAVIAAWTRMEQASRFEQGPTNLTSKGRPKQVGAWITNARGKHGTTPAVPDLATYAVEWQGWWDSLQPEWRRKEGDGRWSVTEGYGEGGREWACFTTGALTEY
ncbi:hypothetical protein B0H14DRAFT_2615197 [Mycena olivaceomarginata]|nr:hypothetical protein B0H14DRAFT_2615197 [Mycena olivaceomarginata]